MRTPTRARSSSSKTPSTRAPALPRTQSHARDATSSARSLAGNGDRDGVIPIDPALLGDDMVDMEDAEGDLVDDELDLIPIGTYDPVQYPLPASPSTASFTTPVLKKRGRPFKDPSARAQAVFHPPDKGKGKGKVVIGSAQTTPGRQNGHHRGIVARDDFCSFCAGTDDRNKAQEPERMVSCYNCGRSGHPTCLNMLTPRLRAKVMTYAWTCIECKTCEACNVKGDDSRLMFCDTCDRGWHNYCLNPPLPKPPKGTWHCPKCPSSSSRHPLTVSKSAPTSDRKGKGRPSLVQDTMSTPTARGRKQDKGLTPSTLGHEDSSVFEKSGFKVKLPRRDKGKGRGPRQESEEEGPPMIVRLRVPSGKRDTAEAESEEEKVPYGGIISGADADTSKTAVGEADKEAFERARRRAEARLGGPPPPMWDPQLSLGTSPAPSPNPLSTPTHSKTTPLSGHGSVSRGLRDRLLQQSVTDSASYPFPITPGPSYTPHHASSSSFKPEKIKTIRFGQYDIDTWYSAPYPEEYQHVPDGRLWLCEFCLKYMRSGFVAGRHRLKCKVRHPPGDEIYRDASVSVFEVDGRKNKIYCQNLCLLAKMFLDHKTLYYDVEPFLFYVMTEVDELGARFVGYFSKEKRSIDNNVSCIMTLPVRQRKGWGQLLIDFSYLLSKKECRVGSPEKPLSGLGAVTYKGYWKLAVFDYLRNAPARATMDDISLATSMTLEDIYSVLEDNNMIRILDSPVRSTPSRGRVRGRGRSSRGGRSAVHRRRASPAEDHDEPSPIRLPSRYEIVIDRDFVEAVLRTHEEKGYLKLRPDRLKYHPFLVTRNPTVNPVVAAQATLQAAGLESTTSPSDLLVTPGPDSSWQANADNGDGVLNGHVVGDEAKIAAGEDQATLDLVAELSSSPQRSLRRKRASEEYELESPAKQLRTRGQDMDGLPAHAYASGSLSTRRSLRGTASLSGVEERMNGHGHVHTGARGRGDIGTSSPSRRPLARRSSSLRHISHDPEPPSDDRDAQLSMPLASWTKTRSRVIKSLSIEETEEEEEVEAGEQRKKGLHVELKSQSSAQVDDPNHDHDHDHSHRPMTSFTFRLKNPAASVNGNGNGQWERAADNGLVGVDGDGSGRERGGLTVDEDEEEEEVEEVERRSDDEYVPDRVNAAGVDRKGDESGHGHGYEYKDEVEVDVEDLDVDAEGEEDAEGEDDDDYVE